MLKANKTRWFEKIFAVYNRNLFKRRFHSINVSGLDYLKNSDDKIPLIIYANNSGWWDGLLIFEICRRANRDFYVLMEEKQLKTFPLFRRIGAFSVVRESPREAVKSINYAVELLKKNPSKPLLIFPQGEIQPNDLRPLKFFNGLSRIVEKLGECSVVSTAIRYEFLKEFKPEIFVNIEEVEKMSGESDSKTLTPILAEKLTANLDKLKSNITTKKFADFTNIFRRK